MRGALGIIAILNKLLKATLILCAKVYFINCVSHNTPGPTGNKHPLT